MFKNRKGDRHQPICFRFVPAPVFAVGEGFEPPDPFRPAEFQSAAINHSTIPEKKQLLPFGNARQWYLLFLSALVRIHLFSPITLIL